MLANTFGRGLFGGAARFNVLRSRIAMYAKSAKEEQQLFWQKNQKLNRPLSPHLTIYRLPMTANMSVLHRGTGAALSAVVIFFGMGSFFWTGNFESVYKFLLNNVHPHIVLTCKALLAFPLCYHTITGIRHLIWDSGRGLRTAQLYKSGYAIIPLAILASFAVATM